MITELGTNLLIPLSPLLTRTDWSAWAEWEGVIHNLMSIMTELLEPVFWWHTETKSLKPAIIYSLRLN